MTNNQKPELKVVLRHRHHAIKPNREEWLDCVPNTEAATKQTNPFNQTEETTYRKEELQ